MYINQTQPSKTSAPRVPLAHLMSWTAPASALGTPTPKPTPKAIFLGIWELGIGKLGIARVETVMKQTDVIRRPLITEKTTLLREDGRTLVFEVAPDATKVDIKRAVEKLFGSKVELVRTAIAHGKMKRQGRFVGQRSDWKKAYVKLREGEKIPEFLEGA